MIEPFRPGQPHLQSDNLPSFDAVFYKLAHCGKGEAVRQGGHGRLFPPSIKICPTNYFKNSLDKPRLEIQLQNPHKKPPLFVPFSKNLPVNPAK